ncbi:hypothetical protein IFM89_028983 [Coptis chinensis]|uniref:Uncharacterized protein n=1 Tax=Coptis chinensis TaxID=261450 RepID=A0A835M4L2_9MAGN|nr:hypothetical protein IFM89_028983 [Coptis chinensis]
MGRVISASSMQGARNAVSMTTTVNYPFGAGVLSLSTEREVKLEGELLEYYGLKEQKSDIVELQRQLKIKTVEINMLNISINSLQVERKKLQEEIAEGAAARKELEMARNRIKELQRYQDSTFSVVLHILKQYT